MGVILTRYTGSQGGSAAGAYTQIEKLAMQMEQEFIAAQPYAFKELTYNAQKQLIDIDIWTDSGKVTKLFHKDLSYNAQKQLTRTDLLRVSDSATLTKLFTYNAQKQLTSIEASGSY